MTAVVRRGKAWRRWMLVAATGVLMLLFGSCAQRAALPDAASNSASARVTLLFTNDFESAYDPTPAYWRDDAERIGGVAHLATLIDQYRQREPTVFLFDAGDIFTGTLAERTRGEIAFELMLTMGYDAMAIGNHEFEYGWQELARQKERASFPVLGANLRYKDSGRAFAQGYCIVERDGVRIGVIGVMGQDAATALIPSNIAGLIVDDPVPVVARHVAMLRDSVDVVVVLIHQGPTAPMQTNDEAVPEVYRGNDENLALAAAVPGIDVLLAGHTDAGTPSALIDPVNGTRIMQTWGQGQHLGVLQLQVDVAARGQGRTPVRLVDSVLVPVISERLPADPRVSAKLQRYRALHPDLWEPIGELDRLASRAYYNESDLGNLFADILRQAASTPVGLMPGGALRKDLPAGMLTHADLTDAFPFRDRVAVVELSGSRLLSVLEQGLSLERGLLQVSGMQVRYDPNREPGARIIEATVNGVTVEPTQLYRVATLEILSQGGDSYTAFREAHTTTLLDQRFGDVLTAHFRRAKAHGRVVEVPDQGRYLSAH